MLRSIWDLLSWRKEVLHMHRGKSKMRIVFWYKVWEFDKFVQERTSTQIALESAGWYKPLPFPWM